MLVKVVFGQIPQSQSKQAAGTERAPSPRRREKQKKPAERSEPSQMRSPQPECTSCFGNRSGSPATVQPPILEALEPLLTSFRKALLGEKNGTSGTSSTDPSKSSTSSGKKKKSESSSPPMGHPDREARKSLKTRATNGSTSGNERSTRRNPQLSLHKRRPSTPGHIMHRRRPGTPGHIMHRRRPGTPQSPVFQVKTPVCRLYNPKYRASPRIRKGKPRVKIILTEKRKRSRYWNTN
jgi:hypothetical protein